MRLLRPALAFAFSFTCSALAADLAALRAELEAMFETDQAQRQQMAGIERQHGRDSSELKELWRQQSETDARNIRRLEEIIAEIGWPRRSSVGEKAAQAAFLILQHSDISFQKKYLALCRDAATTNEMSASSLALLEDRVLLREGQKQIYGSQVRRNAAGNWETLPLEDPEHVDERRAKVGLGPLAEYLQRFADRSGGKIADRKDDLPVEGAPPLTQTFFAAGDDAGTACEKLRRAPAQRGEGAVRFQLACREFCARFPRSARYADVRVLAARRAVLFDPADLPKLEGWDPAAGETDPKLKPEQRAEVAFAIANARAERSGLTGTRLDPDARLDLVARALEPHRATSTARDDLIRTALDASAPKAIALLRERYPDDTSGQAAVRVLEAIGQPADLRFTGLDGATFDLRAQRGRVVAIVFWNRGSTDWTTKMLGEVDALARQHGAQNLVLAGVSMESDRAATEAMMKAAALTWPTLHDARGWRNALAERFLVKVAPYYLLFDRAGVLRYRGFEPNSPMTRQRIEALIAEKSAVAP